VLSQVGTTCDTLVIVKLKFVASGFIPNVLQGRITLQLATVFFHSATFLGLCVSRVAAPPLAGFYLSPNHKGSATRLLKHLTETPDVKLFDNLSLALSFLRRGIKGEVQPVCRNPCGFDIILSDKKNAPPLTGGAALFDEYCKDRPSPASGGGICLWHDSLSGQV